MDIYHTAIEAAKEEFREHVIHWLKTRIGFDAFIIGTGKREANGTIAITRYHLEGRSPGLIEDYAKIALRDPLSHRFSAAPEELQVIDVASFYSGAQLHDVYEYFEQNRIRHLMIKGMLTAAIGATLDWIAIYREDRMKPFDLELAPGFNAAMTIALSAVHFDRAVRHCNESQVVHVGMTNRQKEVMHCLLLGWPNKRIAHFLGISENTLKQHLASLYRSLRVTSRSQAILAIAQTHLQHRNR